MTNHNLKIDTKYFERVEQFEHLRTTTTNQNSIHEEIQKEGSQRMPIIWCRTFLSSSLLSKNIKE